MLSSLEARFVRPDYFPSGRTLFPDWPVVDPVRAKWLFIITMALMVVILSFWPQIALWLPRVAAN